MGHVSYNDIIERIDYKLLVQLTNNHVEPGNTPPDDDKINSIIDSTNDTLDGYLRGRYALPLENPSNIVKESGIVIATYRLHALKSIAAMPPSLDTAYNNAISTMNKIQKGEIILDEGTAETRPGYIITNARHKHFRHSTLGRFL